MDKAVTANDDEDSYETVDDEDKDKDVAQGDAFGNLDTTVFFLVTEVESNRRNLLHWVPAIHSMNFFKSNCSEIPGVLSGNLFIFNIDLK